MKLYRNLLVLFALIFSSCFVAANILVYPFADQQKELRFNQLIKELRCPKCQNNNLSDSNSPLSVDLKDIIYEKIKNGESDKEIVNYLKDRYGDFISYRPPLKPSTWLIWFGPFILLAIGGFVIFRFVSARQNKYTSLAPHVSADSKALLTHWSEEADSEQNSMQQNSEKGSSK